MVRRTDGHTTASKAKVSVSVDRSLLREADRLAGRMTRSQMFEHALAQWVRRRGQAEPDQAIERYYHSLTAAERREDENWTSLGDEMMRRGTIGPFPRWRVLQNR
jgi:metal-responsive CopG/Arc/MetJ family transcriptional regulator